MFAGRMFETPALDLILFDIAVQHKPLSGNGCWVKVD